MIASKYKEANYCHYACFPPEIRKIMSKSGSWINNHLFTYTPYTSTWDFPDVIKFRVAVHTLWQKVIRFRGIRTMIRIGLKS